MRSTLPRRRQLKACLHPNLFRWDRSRARLDITVRPRHHVLIDLGHVKHPLFWKYGQAARWRSGLTLRPNAIMFHFRVPHRIQEPDGAVGVDLNFDSADLVTSDGLRDLIDLQPIARLHEHASRKRRAIQRHIAKDLRHQRAVLRRYRGRETRRVAPLLHRAANEMLTKAGPRAIVLENLTDATDTILRRGSQRRSPEINRRLSAWTHGRLAEIVSYKARTPIVWVNPEGTSHECPRCGGQLALPSEERVVASGTRNRMTRQMVCGKCGGLWHRDVTAAIAVLARGWSILRGGTIPPSARSALLEAATWRPGLNDRGTGRTDPGLAAEPMRADDAKSEGSLGFSDS